MNENLENTAELNLDNVKNSGSKKPDNKNKIVVAVVAVVIAIACGIGLVACKNDKKENKPVTSENESENKKDQKTATDKTAPVIKLKADTVAVEIDSKWSATDNIDSVTDDTDKLVQVKKEAKGSAYYFVDDSKVDLTKAGTYDVTVTASDKAGNVATKSFKVTVKGKNKEASKNDSKADFTKTEASQKSDAKQNATSSNSGTELNKSGTTQSSGNQSSSKPAQSASTSKPATQPSTTKPAQSNSNSSSGSSSSAKPSQPAQHVHNWVHVDATGHYDTKTITDKAAWDEVISPAYKDPDYTVCNSCGQKFLTQAEFSEHIYAQDLDDPNSCSGSSHEEFGVYHDSVIQHHDAETHTENVWVQDSAAYDKCSTCGATK